MRSKLLCYTFDGHDLKNELIILCRDVNCLIRDMSGESSQFNYLSKTM